MDVGGFMPWVGGVPNEAPAVPPSTIGTTNEPSSATPAAALAHLTYRDLFISPPVV